MRFTMAPACDGVRMSDGTLYRANRPGGHIEIDNPRHLQTMMGSPNYRQENLGRGGERMGYIADVAEDRTCRQCAFALWPWQDVCPRCGSMVTALDEALRAPIDIEMVDHGELVKSGDH